MTTDERILWMLLGCLLGFIVGYVVRSLQNINDDLDGVDKLIRRPNRELGIVQHRVYLNMALLLVVVLSVWASFSSQRSTNRVTETQKRLTAIATCNQIHIRETIRTLNARTEFTQSQAQANIKLQQAQARYLELLSTPPDESEKEKQQALVDYVSALHDFIKTSETNMARAAVTPYPTVTEFNKCIQDNLSKK